MGEKHKNKPKAEQLVQSRVIFLEPTNPAQSTTEAGRDLFSVQRKKVIQPLTPGLKIEQPEHVAAPPANNSPPSPQGTNPSAEPTDPVRSPGIHPPNLEGVYPDPDKIRAAKREAMESLPPLDLDSETRFGFGGQLASIFGLAALSGAVFHILFNWLFYHLPRSMVVCSQGLLPLSCAGTMLAAIGVFIGLSSMASVAAYYILKKSFATAFYAGGLATSLYFFLLSAFGLNPGNVAKVRWLYQNHLWGEWMVPAGITAVIAGLAYLVLRSPRQALTSALQWTITLASLISILLAPWLVNKTLVHSAKVALHKQRLVNAQIAENTEFPVYALNTTGTPFKLSSVDAILHNAHEIPHYRVIYTMADVNSKLNQQDTLITYIYKGSTNNFNPPTNCGDGKPGSLVRRGAGTYPCPLFLTTPQGRQVFGFITEWRDPNSSYYKTYSSIDSANTKHLYDPLNAGQPIEFYVSLEDGYVLSFQDVADPGRKSPLTTAVLNQFIDGTKLLTGAARKAFLEKNIY